MYQIWSWNQRIVTEIARISRVADDSDNIEDTNKEAFLYLSLNTFTE